jgi:hypothetical protein
VETEDWDRESAFSQVWDAYPAKGRVRRPLSEQYFVEKVIHEFQYIDFLAAIRPGGRWAGSEKWAKWFVMNLPEFINQECWKEDPEPAGGRETASPYKQWEPPA